MALGHKGRVQPPEPHQGQGAKCVRVSAGVYKNCGPPTLFPGSASVPGSSANPGAGFGGQDNTPGDPLTVTWTLNGQTYKAEYILNLWSLSQLNPGPQPCQQEGSLSPCINTSPPGEQQFLLLDLTVKNLGTNPVPAIPQQFGSYIGPNGTLTPDVPVNFPAQSDIGPFENETDANVAGGISPGQTVREDLEYDVPHTLLSDPAVMVYTLNDPRNVSNGTDGYGGGLTTTFPVVGFTQKQQVDELFQIDLNLSQAVNDCPCIPLS